MASERKFVAENGENGQTGKKHGKNGADTIIKVPEGTLIKDAESGKIIFDMASAKEYVLCKGGRGGWGNRHFATPTRQIPRFAKNGTLGEEKEVIDISALVGDGQKGHGGGDAELVKSLYTALTESQESTTSLKASIECHLMGIAAEESRHSHETIKVHK